MEDSRSHPQPPQLPEIELAPFLIEAKIARLATHNRDGTIHLVPIWFKYINEHILMPTQEATRKVRNITRNSSVSVLIDTQEPPYTSVLIYGTGILDYEKVFEKKLEIYRKYFSEDNLPNPYELAKKWTPVIIRVIPSRIIALRDTDTR